MSSISTLNDRDLAEYRYQQVKLDNRTWVALAALAEIDPVNVVSDQLLAAASSVQKLSLRNQLMLLIQAGERGLALRDVDTDDGWRRRGRVPTQPGMRIVRPYYNPRTGYVMTSTARRRYRASHRWDFAQTAPWGDHPAPPATPDTTGDPAAFAKTLTSQCRRQGYDIAPGANDAVDHQTSRVLVDEQTWNADPAALARALITALAQILITAPSMRLAGEGALRAG
jgi:hypothetical protein